MKRLLLLAVLWSGCGYVGEPLPPLLNIPSSVTDLQARQIGDRIRIEFTIPPLSTEGVVLAHLESIEIKIGPPVGSPFSTDGWAAGAAALEGVRAAEGKVVYETPAAPWIGREVVVGTILRGPSGRASGWSNLVSLSLVPPLIRPASLAATDVKEGVRLVWTGNAPAYRILRRGPGEPDFSAVADVSSKEWVDAAVEYGKPYAYQVTGVAKTSTGEALSDASFAVQFLPQDRFPPDPPAALSAVASPSTVELAWEPSPGATGYTVYRAGDDGQWARAGTTDGVPAYSEKPPRSDAAYQYAVTARDAAGNESAKSKAASVTAP